jgi:SAM-dependent methyltransferase
VESEYKCENIWVPQSGTRLGIPLTLIYKNDMFVQDGTMPLYLYGYGSYGLSIENTFDYKILPLLDRGYIYAIAHIRGGSELGYDWYLDGKMYNKLNTFNDFIRCTEFMIQQNYTKEKHIVIEGRSAGGLLIGATITMRPDLYKIAVLGVPFVDVLNTMSDSTIPLTIEEWTQWGNPNIKSDYDYVICLGVLQHTPSPEESMKSLFDMVRPGGAMVIDHYPWNWRIIMPTPLGESISLYRLIILLLPNSKRFKFVENITKFWFFLSFIFSFNSKSNFPRLSYYRLRVCLPYLNK